MSIRVSSYTQTLKKGLIILVLCFLSYLLGRSEAKTQIITKQVEVIKYVKQKHAEIHAQPNASRTDIIRLMYHNRL